MGRALVIGCGGTLGFTWTAAVLAEIERQGWDPRTAEVIIGTSAGAEIAALLGAGISASAVDAATEAAGVTMINSSDWLERPGSVGKAGLGILHICDEDGTELPAEWGSVNLGGPIVTAGDRTQASGRPLPTLRTLEVHGPLMPVHVLRAMIADWPTLSSESVVWLLIAARSQLCMLAS